MTTTTHILLWCLACLTGAPLWVLSAQCLLGLLPARRRIKQADTMPSVTVLVPAHNEGSVIAVTLESLNQALPTHGRIVVIADNCTDDTASIATQHGATVVQRHDTTDRGKGFALAAGLASLATQPPEVVIIVDADCTVTATTLNDLTLSVQATGRPVQGVYLLSPPDKRDTRGVVSSFAFLIKNQARPRGMDLLGLPVPLTGSGMAFPYELLTRAKLATGDIVEDLALGLNMVRLGHGPVLCDSARITGSLPGDARAAVTQRTRWEHGYLSTLLTRTPGLFIRGVVGLSPARIAAAVDLAVPPLSLLVTGALAAAMLTGVLGWLIAVPGPVCLIAGSLAITALSLGLAWARYGRHDLPPSALLAIPGYILWKLPIYARFLIGREKTWVRTERDPQPAPPTHK